jgi:hypothetical protein
MGRDAALELDMIAQVNKMMLVNALERGDVADLYRQKLDAIASRLGAEFAARYDASLQLMAEAARADAARPPLDLLPPAG